MLESRPIESWKTEKLHFGIGGIQSEYKSAWPVPESESIHFIDATTPIYMQSSIICILVPSSLK